MHFQKLALVFAVSTVGLAQDIDNDDVPMQCRDVCSSVLRLTRDCDRNTNNDDAAERQCVCNAQNASTTIPLCAACVMQNGGEMDNDVNDILRECNFAATSYNPTAAATAPPASGTSAAPNGPNRPSGGPMASTTGGPMPTMSEAPSGPSRPSDPSRPSGRPSDIASATGPSGNSGPGNSGPGNSGPGNSGPGSSGSGGSGGSGAGAAGAANGNGRGDGDGRGPENAAPRQTMAAAAVGLSALLAVAGLVL